MQLAGGTNSYTVAKLRAMGLLRGLGTRNWGLGNEKVSQSPIANRQSPIANRQSPSIAGIAYGSYARVLLLPILEELEQREVIQANVKISMRLEEEPFLLWQAVKLADSLVSQLKLRQ
ncbi:hypothetical protein NUACC26_097490 [Scytonema sp. NUACC26]